MFLKLVFLAVVVAFVSSDPIKRTARAANPCMFDVAFLMDSSESITEKQFPNEKVVINSVIDSLVNDQKFSVGSNGLQFALVRFGDWATVVLNLDQSTDKTTVETALNNMYFFPGMSNVHDAFLKAQNVVFGGNGTRSAASKVIVLLSDGSYTEGSGNPEIVANAFKKDPRNSVIAVGIPGLNGNSGAIVNSGFLTKLASSSDLVFDQTTAKDGIVKAFSSMATKLSCTHP